MNTKTDEGLYEKARKLFISKASIDEFAGWATPRQVDAVHRLLDTELANRERAKHDRLLRRARFPVVKGLDGYDFTNVRLPDGYMLDELLGLGFIPRAQDLVFYGKTGRACSTRSSRAATKDGASYSPRTSSSVNGARSSRTTNSPQRSSTASCTTGGSSSSPARAAASVRPSCSAGTPPRNRKNKENACNCLNPKKIHD